MALRELARKGAGLVARVESQPAMFNVARAMTAKVNQVTGAPHGTLQAQGESETRMMTPLSLRHRKPYFHPSIDAPRRAP